MAKKGFQEGNTEHKKSSRGKNKKTLIVEALQRAGQTEEGFYDILVERALNEGDDFAFGELLKRFHIIDKSTFPIYDFKMPSGKNVSKLQQGDAVLKAIGDQKLPIDAGKILIDIIKDVSVIEEIHEHGARLDALESMTGKNV